MDKIERSSRDNLSSPSIALLTFMKSFYKIRSEIQGKIKSFVDKLTKKPNLEKNFFCLGGD